MDDNIPVEEDIFEAVMQLRLHCAGGPSVMRSKHLRLWLLVARREEHPEPGNWEKVVAIIYAAFGVGELEAPCA